MRSKERIRENGRRGQRRRSEPAGTEEPLRMTSDGGERTVSPDSSWHAMTIRMPRIHQKPLTNVVSFFSLWSASACMRSEILEPTCELCYCRIHRSTSAVISLASKTLIKLIFFSSHFCADKGQATLSLGMDLNLDWMTLDDFQKHLNGEDEILSGPPLSPSKFSIKAGFR